MTGPRLYRALLRLFPRPFQEDCADDVGRTFETLWAEAGGRGERARLLARALVRLPGALAAEWWTTWRGMGRTPGPTVAPDTSRRGAGRSPHDRNGRTGMDGWWRNARLTGRMLRRSPAFAWSAILLTGLGVGAVTMIFTVVDHVLLRPLPYPEPERLVLVERGSHSGPFFRELQELETVDRWGATFSSTVNLVGDGDPLRLLQARVSRDFFELFGGGAIRGRMLVEEDWLTGDPVLLDGRSWRTIWGGDPDVVGRTLTLDGRPATVVGVLDPDFQPPEAMVGSQVDVWRPLDWSAEELVEESFSVLAVTGRLAPGASRETAQAEIDGLVTRLAAVSEQHQERVGEPRLLPVTPLREVTVRGVSTGLRLLLGAVALLLLVACANVAHLFLARGLGRKQEMAVRRAMGADTGGLVRQLLVESLVVGTAGGLLGLGLASVGLRSMLALIPDALPRQDAVGLDLRVLAFAAAVSVVTAMVFGLLPALRSVGRDVAGEIRGTGRGATEGRGVRGFRNLLVAGEVAVSLVLVAGAGLLLRSFLGVQSQDPGFEPAGVWTVPLTPQVEDAGQWVTQMTAVREALAALPGVEDAAASLTVPLQYTGGSRCCWSTGLRVEGEDEPARTAVHPVSAEYLGTFGIGLRAGRAWTAAEASTLPAPVVLSERSAVELFGGVEAAVGRPLATSDLELVVVGVAEDVRHYGMDQEVDAAIYLPVEHLPFPIPRAHMAVRLRSDVTPAMARAVREAIWSVAPGLPVPTVRSMEEWLERSTAGRRFDSALFGTFAMLALVLAAGGLYGTMLYLAGQRRREMGIRLALGASAARIEREVLLGGLGLGALGVALGLAGAWASARYLQSRLWGVEPGDPVTLVTSAGLLLLTAALASWLPARRAGRTDPVETLKAE